MFCELHYVQWCHHSKHATYDSCTMYMYTSINSKVDHSNKNNKRIRKMVHETSFFHSNRERKG